MAIHKDNQFYFSSFTGTLAKNTTFSSFLFHFCALVSFISLVSVRSIIKFYLILLFKLLNVISSVERIGSLFPKVKVKKRRKPKKLKVPSLNGEEPIKKGSKDLFLDETLPSTLTDLKLYFLQSLMAPFSKSKNLKYFIIVKMSRLMAPLLR